MEKKHHIEWWGKCTPPAMPFIKWNAILFDKVEPVFRLSWYVHNIYINMTMTGGFNAIISYPIPHYVYENFDHWTVHIYKYIFLRASICGHLNLKINASIFQSLIVFDWGG